METMTKRMACAALCCASVLTLLLSAGEADGEVKRKPTLFIVGDSTVKNNGKGLLGWGDPLIKLFDDNKIKVENHAIGGRSSRTFQTEGRWDKILDAAKPGDFVLIQMGHNDGGPLDDAARARGSIRGTGDESKEIDNPITKKKELVHTYGWYMRKYISDARAKGMTPIVCSPVPHAPAQKVKDGDVEKSAYVAWAEEIAKDQKALFIPLNQLIMKRYAGMEVDALKTQYFGSADHTHTNQAGAELNAQAVVEGIRGLKDCALTEYLAVNKTAPEAQK